MSTVQGGQGNIVTDGLVLNLDAANPRSYPQPYNGTTWSNLVAVSSSISGSLINGTAYTGSNNGALVFDGTDDYVSLNGFINLGNTFTIFSWAYLTSDVGGEYVIYGPASNGNDNWLGIWTNKVFFFGTESTDINNFSLFGNTTLSSQKWYQVALTVNTNTVNLYLNGNKDGTVTKSFTIAPWSESINSIGRRGSTSSRYFLGRIANVYTYNRVLSDSEILQNFNATRARFGI